MPAFAAAQPETIVSDPQWHQIKASGLLTAVYNGEQWGYIDSATGAVVITAQYSSAGAFHEGLALTAKMFGGRQRLQYIDVTGKTVIDLTERYGKIDGAGDFSSGIAPVYMTASGHTIYIDKQGRQVMSCPFYARGFHDGLAAAPAAGGYGYINTSGVMVIPAKFDEAWNFCAGRALVRENGRFGVIDKTGSYVLAAQYEDVCIADAQYAQQIFCTGLAVIKKDGKWGAVNAAGALIVPAEWDALRAFAGGYAPAMKAGKWGLVDTLGKTVVPAAYEEVTSPVNGQVFLKKNGAYTLYDLSAGTTRTLDTAGWTNVARIDGAFVYKKGERYGLVVPSDAPSPWAQTEVEQAVNAGLVPQDMQRGYTENCTRADFCRLAVQVVESHTKKSAADFIRSVGLESGASFSDTAAAGILAAAAMGIVNGRPDGTFGPEELITREQAAAMLTRTAQLLSGLKAAAAPAFNDASDTAAWARGSVEFVSANGIMRGDSARFYPKALYTREQAYLTVFRLFKLL